MVLEVEVMEKDEDVVQKEVEEVVGEIEALEVNTNIFSSHTV